MRDAPDGDNLLEETTDLLAKNGKKPDDVLWVGSEEFGWFSWDEFASMADTIYSAGYGSSEVADDLLVVGSDFWLERHEYDGSEWWEFKFIPHRPESYRKPESLTIHQAKEKGLDFVGWKTLRQLHDGRGPF